MNPIKDLYFWLMLAWIGIAGMWMWMSHRWRKLSAEWQKMAEDCKKGWDEAMDIIEELENELKSPEIFGEKENEENIAHIEDRPVNERLETERFYESKEQL